MEIYNTGTRCMEVIEVVDVVPFQCREPHGKSHHDFSVVLGHHPTHPQIGGLRTAFKIKSVIKMEKTPQGGGSVPKIQKSTIQNWRVWIFRFFSNVKKSKTPIL